MSDVVNVLLEFEQNILQEFINNNLFSPENLGAAEKKLCLQPGSLKSMRFDDRIGKDFHLKLSKVGANFLKGLNCCWATWKDDKPNAVFDFDGVIHPYTLPFSEKVATEAPYAGTKEALEHIREKYNVFILSTRSILPEGRRLIRQYCRQHKIKVDGIISGKIRAKFYVDDRAFRFQGGWYPLAEFASDERMMKPWNKKDAK